MVINKIYLTYFNISETPVLNKKYFRRIPEGNDELKDFCSKVKIGKTENGHNSMTFYARSTLVREHVSNFNYYNF